MAGPAKEAIRIEAIKFTGSPSWKEEGDEASNTTDVKPQVTAPAGVHAATVDVRPGERV